jgi:chemotaxis protein CheD
MSGGRVDAAAVDSDRVNVGVAEYRITNEAVKLSTSGLGSCLAVVLFDGRGTAGLGHFMLPKRPNGSDDVQSKFVDTGIRSMLEEMNRIGVDRSNLRAKIAGGSTLLPNPTGEQPIGPQNVDEAQRILGELQVPVLGMDVGEDYGRSVEFDMATETMTVDGAHEDTIQI